MKKLFFIPTILIMLSGNTFAATISVGDINNIHVADQFISSSSSAACIDTDCHFTQTFTDNYLNDEMLGGITTSNYATSIKSPIQSNAYIDIGFSTDMFNGIGNDLILFFVGSGTSFNLDVFSKDDDINSIFSEQYTIKLSDKVPNTTSEGTGWLCISAPGTACTGTPLTAVLFDLGDGLASDIAINRLRISFGNEFTPDTTSSNFSLAGGFHNESITAVPLPLSAVLFGSGLSLLGWFGRRKTA